MKKAGARLLTIALLAITSPAQPGARREPKVYVLRAARMFDAKSDRVTTPGLVVVAGGAIQAVGAGARRDGAGAGRHRLRPRPRRADGRRGRGQGRGNDEG